MSNIQLFYNSGAEMTTSVKLLFFLSLVVLISCDSQEDESSKFLGEFERIYSFKEPLDTLTYNPNFGEKRPIVLGADPAKNQQFADFLNGLYGSSLGADILKKCSKPYSPDPKAHDGFIAAFQKVNTNVNTLLTKKAYKDVNGEVCRYNTADPNVFISAKKVEIPTTVLFIQYTFKNSFGISFMEFSKCIGSGELSKIADPAFIEELFYIFSSDKITKRLFESFCSVNNIFFYLKGSVDPKDANIFKKMGIAMNGILKEVKLHYEFIKNK